MPKRLGVLVPVVLGLVSLSCSLFGPAATPTAPPTLTAVVMVESAQPQPPTSTPPAPPEATATTPPSPSPVPASTDTPAPTGLNAAGPYVLFNAGGGVWVSNPDGSFLTRLFDREASGDLHRALAPRGDRLALVVRTEDELDLVIVKVPSGETEMTIRLIALTEAEEIADPASEAAFALYAMRDYPSVAWSPGDGRWLAFVGAIAGPTADLYLYDTQTQTFTQMTDGPSQAVLPEWSPDGQYILHAGVSWVPPFGGAILGANQLDGVWAVRVADGAVIEQPKPAGVHPNFAGWEDAAHYWTYDSDEECFAQDLRAVDVASGTAEPGLDFSFYGPVAVSPSTGVLLISGAAGCPSALGEGVFVLRPGEGLPTRLLDKRAYEIRWLPESQVFLAYPEALVSADGQQVYAPPVYDASFHPAISRAGYEAWEVIQNQAGRAVVRAPGEDWRTVLEGFVDELIWDPVDGQTLLIALQDGALYAATAPDFAPQFMGSLGGRVRQAVWAPGPRH